MTDTTKTTDEAVAWFARLRDPEASEADWLAFVDWIEGAPERRHAYDAVEQSWVEVEDDVEVVEDQPRLRPANDDRPVRKASRRWVFGAVATAACAVLAFGVWPHLSSSRIQTYASGDKAQTITLSDGSRVWLNRDTTLEARMGRGERDIVLNGGEAAFDVAHDAARPFVVHAGDRSVRVLGTAFDVIHQGDRFVVQVERGKVAVTPAGAVQATSLSAGQSLRQSGRGAVSVVAEDPETISVRRDGILVYREAMLAEVADDLSLYLDKVVIVDDAARELRFSGVLKADDEVTVLGQLEAFAPIRIVRTSNEVRISAL